MGIRIAIDTGGTFTDIVAIDEVTGDLTAVKTPSTPKDPSIGLLNGIEKVLGAIDRKTEDMTMLLHGSTVATNAVLEHKFGGLGLIVTRGFRHMIEIARQSVPDGYGNSFFWVKPPRLVPLHLVREIPGRLKFDGSELEPTDKNETLNAVRELVEDGVTSIAVCLLHSYANFSHEKEVGDLIAEEFPDIFVSLSSVVLPEYREYERAMTTLMDVLVKPFSKTYLQNAADRIEQDSGPIPFLIMQSNGGVVKHSTASERPVTMLLSGPAAGLLGAIHMAKLAGHRNLLTVDVGGTSTDIAIIEDCKPMYTSTSSVESYPVKTPQLDIVTVGSGGGSIAWIDPYGSLKVGPKSAGADPGPICYGKGGTQPTITDAAVLLGRLPEALIGGELKLDRAAARAAFDELGRQSGILGEDVAAGVLEIAAANQVFGIRKVTTTRGRDPADYTMVAFGGAGGLFASEIADFLAVGTIISPPNPGNLCAFGLHVSDVRRDYIKTIVRQQSSADEDEILAQWAKLADLSRIDIRAEGVPDDKIEAHLVADVRYFGEGHEVQVEIPDGVTGPEAVAHMWKHFHAVHDQIFGFNYEGEQEVELVNLRVNAVGVQTRPVLRQNRETGHEPNPGATRKVYWRKSGWVDCPIYQRTQLGVGRKVSGPAILEEYGSTVVVPVSWSAWTDPYGNLILEKSADEGTANVKASASRKLGPIELEVIHGTIRAAELEIEAAVERTARSPMIRDQHDYRVALFDARGRKLTGRSYSAIVEPVFEYFDRDDIHPGDIFFWNDPYNSCGGIGHVPDLCTTVPIFYDDTLIGFSQVFGHHDDVGGSVPGSLPVHATDSWMEGVLVPPIKLYDRGVLNEAAFKIITRNSRLSEHLAGDLDAESGAARIGSRRMVALAERYGVQTLEAAFDQILANTAEIFRHEILPKIKDGEYHFEDYIEADGVDEPRMHALRLKMTKTPDKIVLDFTGTDPEAKGPINWSLDEAEGRYFRKWLAPVLRSLAKSPERAAEIDSNEGVLDVIDVIFPQKGTLITPNFSKPTGMRFFLMLRSLGVFAACLSKATGGAMPADHETIRIWGMTGGHSQEDFYLFREVLGGGSPGRPWADGSDVVHIVPNSKNLPAEFSETRYPILIERLALKEDSGGAGLRRGGCGYDKQVRTLEGCRLISNADRSLLGCYGVNGGLSGGNYSVSVFDSDGTETRYPGMCDTVTVDPGSVVRIVTTGGGGWGDPLQRPADLVIYDVQCGLVSAGAAQNHYGVVLRQNGRKWGCDADATQTLRTRLARERGEPNMFERGDYFVQMKAKGAICYPENWTDPDQGWKAQPVS